MKVCHFVIVLVTIFGQLQKMLVSCGVDRLCPTGVLVITLSIPKNYSCVNNKVARQRQSNYWHSIAL
jgi:hypothetical protein